MSAPLHGLVLAGGRSTRMGRDKAALEYSGRSQLERAFALLDPLVARAFVSVRADQGADPLRARFPQIVDAAPGLEGPVAGILTALRAHPAAAWLVLACDLPFLDAGTLQHLIARRDPTRIATAFRSSHGGLPEPLCAIYEPAALGELAAFVAGGRNCPRKFLINSGALLLDQPRAEALDNVNTPTELDDARQRMSQPAVAARELRVQYFALLREQAGRRDETLTTGAPTPRELFAELAARHGFTLAPEHLKVAVNSEFSDWSRPLAAGDHVVFIPPVAGG
jgi:molybdopterin-guanine dinucleotide biosynthesis protein A